jgi:lipopolysaccharide/colanic/teichoic acid biosynthesis glycosyltransferase
MNDISRNPGVIADDVELGRLLQISGSRKWIERKSIGDALYGAGYLPLKRLLDIVISSAIAILTLPLLAVCAIAIKLSSPGPVFLFQNRTGQGETSFRAFKLRTMVENAAELREKYLHLNELKLPDFKITNDPRVTLVGRFLRRYSLDELPQVFNVLKGDMSLVGPRPSSYNARKYHLWHTERFEIKPGMTGLAQVSGRSKLMLDEKVRYDIAYLRNISLWLDLKILFKTVKVVLRARGVK